MVGADHVDGATSASSPVAASTSPAEDVVPTLRLCQLISWPSYGGSYGFDVVSDHRGLRQTAGTGRDQSSRLGHFIGKVNSRVVH